MSRFNFHSQGRIPFLASANRLWWTAPLLCSVLMLMAAALYAEDTAFFETRIRPVLINKCYECHSAGAKKVKAQLYLDTRAGIRKGGETGPAVVPGNVAASLLMKAIRYSDKDMQMPPKEQLPDSVIADFEQWIAMGATDPREGGAMAKLKMSEEEAKTFWSFQPVKKPALPELRDKTWPWSPLDHFVRSAQEAKDLKPVGEADRMTMVRRIYFDLIGLPPTPEEAHAYVNDPDTNVLEKTVDKLLRSPQFGERWGRHWLDIARYGESTGKERNYPFQEAWRYRDYVINAFNNDKPYDDFIREQIAGDLLPAKSAQERNDFIVATGLLALGPKSVGEKNHAVFENDLIDEQVDVVTRGFIGMTVSCARCHDHKFDPVAMKDYYAMAGIFRSTQTCFGVSGTKVKNPAPLLPLVAETTPVSQALQIKDADEESSPSSKGKKGKKGKKKQYSSGSVQTVAMTSDAKVTGSAMGVIDSHVVDSPVFARGEPDEPGDTVARGFVPAIHVADAPAIPADQSGRLQLAAWIASPQNPLTARVAVNRVWLQLFGAGIVATSDNFGFMGTRPSNQALLDHLAAEFMQQRWSMKKLIRSIVLSHTYQLSSARDAKNESVDPDNITLWHMQQRRLDAEAIRDAVLAITGDLDKKPPHGSEVSKFPNADLGKANVYGMLENDSVVRSVYLPIVRNRVPEVLDMFDFAEPSLLTASRDVTNVPPQALFMLNGDFIDKQSNIAARVLMKAPMDDAQRIVAAYWRMLCRPPTKAEQKRATDFLQHMGKLGGAAERGYTALCQALFACAEFRYIR
jgi:Protein of unknown function (DUF1553)/Protein of unknown function (DUF1549)/Planctomycete cytochrome C